MPWVAPRTFVTDEFMTASMFNTNIRDNMGEAWREVELINSGTTGATNNAVYNVDAGGQVCAFASRTYPGFPIEIQINVWKLISNVGNWLVLGAHDESTIGTTTPHYMGQTNRQGSGLYSVTLTPTPGVHTYRVVLWGGNGGIPSNTGSGGVNAYQARLLEKAGA
jgi:hypothetical protein